jgi:hypothetical protein
LKVRSNEKENNATRWENVEEALRESCDVFRTWALQWPSAEGAREQPRHDDEPNLGDIFPSVSHSGRHEDAHRRNTSKMGKLTISWARLQ